MLDVYHNPQTGGPDRARTVTFGRVFANIIFFGFPVILLALWFTTPHDKD